MSSWLFSSSIALSCLSKSSQPLLIHWVPSYTHHVNPHLISLMWSLKSFLYSEVRVGGSWLICSILHLAWRAPRRGVNCSPPSTDVYDLLDHDLVNKTQLASAVACAHLSSMTVLSLNDFSFLISYEVQNLAFILSEYHDVPTYVFFLSF